MANHALAPTVLSTEAMPSGDGPGHDAACYGQWLEGQGGNGLMGYFPPQQQAQQPPPPQQLPRYAQFGNVNVMSTPPTNRLVPAVASPPAVAPTTTAPQVTMRFMRGNKYHRSNGSLGTPRMIGVLAQRTPTASSFCSAHSHRSSAERSCYGQNSNQLEASLYSFNSSSNTNLISQGGEGSAMELTPVILPPTRPLLKTLAKLCRPHPPWCVGVRVPAQLGDEVLRFTEFCLPTAAELSAMTRRRGVLEEVVHQIWPDAELVPMSVTAAGQVAAADVPTHYYLTQSAASAGAVGPEWQARWREAALKYNLQVDFTQDARGAECAVLIDATETTAVSKLGGCDAERVAETESIGSMNQHNGEGSAGNGPGSCGNSVSYIRYGPRAPMAALSAEVFSHTIAAHESSRAVYSLLLTLLAQTKLLDDLGLTTEAVSGEAIAVLLLAVMNSYDTSDTPDAGRLLLDFFLTYGFEAYFSSERSSVCATGMQNPPPKVHADAQLSVLDLNDPSINLTPALLRANRLQAIFNYCYTALSQYAQLSAPQRRPQSALSTIIGGEPFWGRVLKYHQQQVEPYYSVVQSKMDTLIQFV